LTNTFISKEAFVHQYQKAPTIARTFMKTE